MAVIVKAGAARLSFDPATFAGHSLRSGLVTTAVKRGVNLMKIEECRTIQKLMRHRHIGTTVLYCDVSDDTLWNAEELV